MSNATSARSTATHTTTRRRWLLVGSIAGGLLVLVLAVLGYMAWRMNYVPTDLDFSRTRVSEQGMFSGTYSAGATPITINKIHSWTLHVASPSGEPIENAQIVVDGGMPQHGHGLPTQPQVTQYLGNGDYLVEGMKFQMSGWWVVNFNVDANGTKDTITFNLMLE